jgi:sialic acid synthase SpsE
MIKIPFAGKDIGIGAEAPVFIIAEIGKGFIQSQEPKSTEEYLANAIALVKAAKESGADAVKFQTHTVEDEQVNIDVTSPHFKGSDRYSWVKRNEDSTPVETFWKPLKKACDDLGILFFSTPMSRMSAQKLHDQVGVPFWKVGSGDVLDFVLLDYLRNSGKPIMFSTGMSTLEEIDKALAFMKEKTSDLVLLHCISRYPCPPEDLHLNTIRFFAQRYDIPVGFSDHSIGFDSAIAAAALGATVIEKHFTFDRALWGSDHKVSMLPDEFKQMVEGIRRVKSDAAYREQILSSEIVQKGMGSEAKTMDDGETGFRPLFRKTLCAAADLPVGHVLAPEDIYAMRPQAYLDGAPSEEYATFIGKTLNAAVIRFQPLKTSFLV